MRLLIVEDELRLTSALPRRLAAEGSSIEVEHTGPNGLHAAQEVTYDTMILEIMLPGPSGYRIIETARRAELGADPDADGSPAAACSPL